jgi:hypothetical protein
MNELSNERQMCAHAREGGAAVNAEDKAVEGVGAPRLVRCSSLPLTRYILFKEEFVTADRPAGVLQHFVANGEIWFDPQGNQVSRQEVWSLLRSLRRSDFSHQYEYWKRKHFEGAAVALWEG